MGKGTKGTGRGPGSNRTTTDITLNTKRGLSRFQNVRVMLTGSPDRKSRGTLTEAFRKMPGGKVGAVELLRRSEDPKIQRFVKKWDDLTQYQKDYADIEDICYATECSPELIVAEVSSRAYRESIEISNLIAAIHHPKVVEATVKNALKPSGTFDRKMLHEHAQFLPTKGGMNINVSANAAAQNNQETTIQGHDSGLPSFEEDVSNTVKVIRGDEDEATSTHVLTEGN